MTEDDKIKEFDIELPKHCQLSEVIKS